MEVPPTASFCVSRTSQANSQVAAPSFCAGPSKSLTTRNSRFLEDALVLTNSALAPSTGKALSWQKDGRRTASNESSTTAVSPFEFNFIRAGIALLSLTVRILRFLWKEGRQPDLRPAVQ